MDTAAFVLLIIVSSVLSVFLLVLIAVLIKIFMIIRQVKRLLNKAEMVAEKAEAVGDFFKRTAGPVSAVRTIVKMVNRLTTDNKAHKEKD